MFVSRIAYTDWRNIASASVSLERGVNVLWGANAQGKSNILEGLYYFARGRSFRGARERELVRFGADFARAVLAFRKDGYENDTELEAVIPLSGKKRLLRGGAPLSSASEMIGSFRAVLFCPANLSLVSGGPAERRMFLDIALSQLSPAYLRELRAYTRLLSERNALLRRAADGQRVEPTEWAVYDEAMSRAGAVIAAYRNDYVLLLREASERYFAGMTGGAEVPGLIYASHCYDERLPRPLSVPGSWEEPDPAPLYDRLVRNREREIAAGSTLWGIHRDDVSLTLNGADAKIYASQGQQRSLVLSLKLGEAEIAAQVGREAPVILLDDVFSELDESRRRYLLDSLGLSGESGKPEQMRQIIITSCEPDVIPGSQAAHVHFRRVEGGTVTE